MSDLERVQSVRDTATQIFDLPSVKAAISDIAEEITVKLSDSNPVLLVAMNGGLVFAGQLLPQLDFPLQLDYAHTSRYGHNTKGGALQWLAEPKLDLRDRTVLIVDDILDRGNTLKAIHQHCIEVGARSVLSVVLIQKILIKNDCCFAADFIALQAPDAFLFGSGLDYQGYWRNAPGIYSLNPVNGESRESEK